MSNNTRSSEHVEGAVEDKVKDVKKEYVEATSAHVEVGMAPLSIPSGLPCKAVSVKSAGQSKKIGGAKAAEMKGKWLAEDSDRLLDILVEWGDEPKDWEQIAVKHDRGRSRRQCINHHQGVLKKKLIKLAAERRTVEAHPAASGLCLVQAAVGAAPPVHSNEQIDIMAGASISLPMRSMWSFLPKSVSESPMQDQHHSSVLPFNPSQALEEGSIEGGVGQDAREGDRGSVQDAHRQLGPAPAQAEALLHDQAHRSGLARGVCVEPTLDSVSAAPFAGHYEPRWGSLLPDYGGFLPLHRNKDMAADLVNMNRNINGAPQAHQEQLPWGSIGGEGNWMNRAGNINASPMDMQMGVGGLPYTMQIPRHYHPQYPISSESMMSQRCGVIPGEYARMQMPNQSSLMFRDGSGTQDPRYTSMMPAMSGMMQPHLVNQSDSFGFNGEGGRGFQEPGAPSGGTVTGKAQGKASVIRKQIADGQALSPQIAPPTLRQGRGSLSGVPDLVRSETMDTLDAAPGLTGLSSAQGIVGNAVAEGSATNNAPWTPTEDIILRNGHRAHQGRWPEIVKLLPGRTEKGIQNRWKKFQQRLKKNRPATTETIPLPSSRVPAAGVAASMNVNERYNSMMPLMSGTVQPPIFNPSQLLGVGGGRVAELEVAELRARGVPAPVIHEQAQAVLLQNEAAALPQGGGRPDGLGRALLSRTAMNALMNAPDHNGFSDSDTSSSNVRSKRAAEDTVLFNRKESKIRRLGGRDASDSAQGGGSQAGSDE